MKMMEGRVITDEAKYNFFCLLQKLGHPKIGLEKELGLDCSIYDMFFTKRYPKTRKHQSLILMLLDFGIKCGLDEAARLQEHFLEYCTRRIGWEQAFAALPPDEMISSMELDWTYKLCEVIRNLQKLPTDMNYRLKHIFVELNQVKHIDLSCLRSLDLCYK